MLAMDEGLQRIETQRQHLGGGGILSLSLSLSLSLCAAGGRSLSVSLYKAGWASGIGQRGRPLSLVPKQRSMRRDLDEESPIETLCSNGGWSWDLAEQVNATCSCAKHGHDQALLCVELTHGNEVTRGVSSKDNNARAHGNPLKLLRKVRRRFKKKYTYMKV
ncbi:hypothetical protein L7F22_006274 [Adiantum nelumboides]|nr:hypothetical protein [Adiantum nelumboides]